MNTAPKISLHRHTVTDETRRTGWPVMGTIAAPTLRGFARPTLAATFGLVALMAVSNCVAGNSWPERSPDYADSVSLRMDASLWDVAFHPSRRGLAVGDRGTILLSEDGGASWAIIDSDVNCNLRAVKWLDSRNAIAIGGAYDRVTGISRGVVLYSDNAGKQWRRAEDGELPRLRQLSLGEQPGVVFAQGDHSHVALARLFQSNDGGRTWQGLEGKSLDDSGGSSGAAIDSASKLRQWTEACGASAPIRGACRIGQEIWAVGDHGVILHSEDSGKRWSTQRGEGRQTCLLIVAASPESIPWGLLGSESLESRNRSAVLLESHAPTQQRLDAVRQSTVWLGGAAADIVRPAGVLRDSRAGQVPRGPSEEAADWIAIHRPRVIVLGDGLSDSTRQSFSQAAIAAGVSRVVSCSATSYGDRLLHCGALLPRRGVLIGDLWKDALHLVAPADRPPASVSLRRVYDAAGSSGHGDSVVAGVVTKRGHKLAASAEPASRRQLQVVQARMSQSKRVSKLMEETATSKEFADSLKRMLDQTTKEDAFRLAWSVWLEVLQASQIDSARHALLREATLSEMASRFGDRSAGKWAALYGDTTTHSQEWQFVRRSMFTDDRPLDSPAASVAVSPFQVDTGSVRQVGAIAPIVVPEQTNYQVTGEQTKSVEVDLAWEFHPLVLVAREAARQRGDGEQLVAAVSESANLKRLVTSPDAGVWGKLLPMQGPHVISARRAGKRPRLDGDLRESCWEAGLPRAGSATSLRVAYDDEYVYFAIRSRLQSDGVTDTKAEASQGRRDHDLGASDRIGLRIDTDSDLLTAMQLEVTESGLTYDAIDGNQDWQPTWYVASRRNGDHVEVEIAVLRRDLSDLPLYPGQSWFVSAELLNAGQSNPWTPLPDPSDWQRVVFR